MPRINATIKTIANVKSAMHFYLFSIGIYTYMMLAVPSVVHCSDNNSDLYLANIWIVK